jgi:hypothetical protein
MYIKPIVVRRAAAATGFCLTGLMLTACQASTTPGAAGAPSSAATTPAAVSMSSGATTGSANGSIGSTGSNGSNGTNSGSASGSCSSGKLKASTSYNSAYNSGNTLIAYIVLTNTSTASCTIDGYAGVDFLDPSGKSLGMTTQRVPSSNAAPENTQTLAPGKSASEEFTFAYAGNDQGNGCANAGTIAVIPPNQTQALDTKLTSVKTGTIPFFGVCAGSITVFPIGPADQIPS